MRRSTIVFSAALASALIGGIASADIVVPTHHRTETFTFKTAVTRVELTGDATSLKVAAGRSVLVKADKAWQFNEPSVTVSLTRGVLKISTDCNDAIRVGPVGVGAGLNDCFNDLTITVPAATNVSLSTGGPITSKGINGDQSLHTASGAITIDNAQGGSITAVSGYGKVQLSNSKVRTASLTADSGEVTATQVRTGPIVVGSGYGLVTLTDVTGSSAVSAHTDSGNINVQRVAGTDLAVASGYGSLSVLDSRFARTTLRTDSGNINVQRVVGTDLAVASGYGSLSVLDSRFARTTLRTDSGNVVARGLRTDSLESATDYGTISLRDVSTTSKVDLRSKNGDLDIQRVSGAVLFASSNSTISVSNARFVKSTDLRSDNGSVKVTALRTGSFESHAGSASTSIEDLAASSDVRLRSDSGDVDVSHATGSALSVLTGNGKQMVDAARFTTVRMESDTANLDASLISAPDALIMTTSSGTITAEVPRGTYDVSATSQSGTVRVQGLTNDTHAARSIRARSDSGNVDVIGR